MDIKGISALDNFDVCRYLTRMRGCGPNGGAVQQSTKFIPTTFHTLCLHQNAFISAQMKATYCLHCQLSLPANALAPQQPQRFTMSPKPHSFEDSVEELLESNSRHPIGE
jgi:hypothetical protein